MLVDTEFGLIPAVIMDGIENYVDNGDHPQGVLVPILMNNEQGILELATIDELKHLVAIKAFVAHRVPEECRGSFGAICGYTNRFSNEEGYQ